MSCKNRLILTKIHQNVKITLIYILELKTITNGHKDKSKFENNSNSFQNSKTSPPKMSCSSEGIGGTSAENGGVSRIVGR